MATPHRLAQNDVSFSTTPSEIDLLHICGLAATRNTGQLLNGMRGIEEVANAADAARHLTTGGLIGSKQLLFNEPGPQSELRSRSPITILGWSTRKMLKRRPRLYVEFSMSHG